MLMAASAIFAMNSCKEDTPVEELDGPSIEWESNSDFKLWMSILRSKLLLESNHLRWM